MTVLLPRDRKRSRYLFDWSARWAIERNTLDAISGQDATFARTSVGAGIGSNGLYAPAAHSQPAWHWVDTDGDGILEPHVLLQDTRTNVVLHKRDLTNAVWTKTSATAAKDQVGIDGVANSASSLVSTAANGTCIQNITLASSARLQSAWVKRLTGSGTIQMTTDNGTTWTAVTVTSSWAKVTIPTQTLANPSVGFRIVTSGDKIAVDWVTNENGSFVSGIIGNSGDNSATETRAADSLSFAFNAPPRAMTVYLKLIELGTLSTGATASAAIGIGASSNPAFFIYNDTGGYEVVHRRSSDVSSTPSVAVALGSSLELRAALNADGSVLLGQSIAGATEAVGTTSSANALAAAWNNTTLTINSRGAGTIGFGAYSLIRVAAGVQTLAYMRAG